MSYKRIVPFLMAWLPLSALAQGAAHPVVWELFTSQGCSSCPPADALALRHADDEDVLVLSFHVDYWNRLGWKDPFSSPVNTQRQQLYARQFGARGVYTPQAVIQGAHDIVGSDASAIRRALSKAQHSAPWVHTTLKRNGDTLSLQLPSSPGIKAVVLLLGYQKHNVTHVERGENANNTLAHRNSVTSITGLGTWEGDARSISPALPNQGDGIAILLQQPETGQIIGAAWL